MHDGWENFNLFVISASEQPGNGWIPPTVWFLFANLIYWIWNAYSIIQTHCIVKICTLLGLSVIAEPLVCVCIGFLCFLLFILALTSCFCSAWPLTYLFVVDLPCFCTDLDWRVLFNKMTCFYILLSPDSMSLTSNLNTVY